MTLSEKLKNAVRQILLENRKDPEYHPLLYVNIWTIATSALQKGDVIYLDSRSSAASLQRNARVKGLTTKRTKLISPDKEILYKVEFL